MPKTSEKVCCHGFRGLDLQKTALLVKDSTPMVHFSPLKQYRLAGDPLQDSDELCPRVTDSFPFIMACSWVLTLESRHCICVVNQPMATFEAEENLRINRMCVNNTVANLFWCTFRTNNLTYFSETSNKNDQDLFCMETGIARRPQMGLGYACLAQALHKAPRRSHHSITFPLHAYIFSNVDRCFHF